MLRCSSAAVRHAHPPDDLTQLGTIGHDNKVGWPSRPTAAPRAGRRWSIPAFLRPGFTPADRLWMSPADDVEHQVERRRRLPSASFSRSTNSIAPKSSVF